MAKLSADSHSFAITPSINAPRSLFNRDSTYKTAFDIGWLVPYFWDEVYPGDTFSINTTAFARLSTPLFPIMDGMYMDFHWFFSPNRILWSSWRKFMGEQIDPGDSIDYTIPVLSDSGGSVTSDADISYGTDVARAAALMNYLGIPDGISASDVTDINALPFRCYSRIYNEWFRDQNLIDSTDPGLRQDDGPDAMHGASGKHMLQRRGKRHDYFTSALPWPNKADAIYGTSGVTLPLGTSAPLIRDGSKFIRLTDGNETLSLFKTAASSNVEWSGSPSFTGGVYPKDDDATGFGIIADLTNATSATINDIREAFQIQKLLERDAMGGTRYPEIILNHFGVSGFYDASYRPEYLGGSSVPVNISPVAQTGTTTSGIQAGVGDLAAFGVAMGNVNINKTFVEHGIIMGIVSVRADLHYQQGLRREFSRSTRYDYYFPSLAHLGMQPIYNKELYCDGSANDDLVFGYQNRYDELRYRQSQITGQFQSAATSTLEAWHLADDYASLPTLGQTFIEVNADLDRCVQVSSEPHFIFDSLTKCRCARPMPANATPGLIDHF